MSPNASSPDVFKSTQWVFEQLADIDEKGYYCHLSSLVQALTKIVVDYVYKSNDLETASASACTVLERFICAIHEYSEYIKSMEAFINQAKLLFWLISKQINTHIAQNTLSVLVKYLKESVQVKEDDRVIMIELFLNKIHSEPDLCLKSILSLIEKPDWPEVQSAIFSKIFSNVVPFAESSKMALVVIAESFARRPALLMPLIDGLSPSVKKGLILELPGLINSAARSPLLKSALNLLLQLVQPEDNSLVPADSIADFLDSNLSEDLTSQILMFYCLDNCLTLIQFVTHCTNPRPDPELCETHLAVRRSFAVVQLLTRKEAKVVIECHGATIIRLLLNEGLNPDSANLYHVCAILSFLLSTKPDIFCQTFMLISPLDNLLQLRSYPPITHLLEALCSQNALLSYFAQQKLAFKLVDLAVCDANSESESDLALLLAMLERWTLLNGTALIVNADLLEHIESKAVGLNYVLIALLSALSHYVTNPPLLTELSLSSLSIANEDDLFDAMCSRIPSFCEMLCDDNRWIQSNKFCRHRFLLLSLIILLIEFSNDTMSISERFLKRCWEWTCDQAVVPLVHIKMARFWRLWFHDVHRLKLFSATTSFLDDMLKLCEEAVPPSTIKSVMMDLLMLILNLIEKNELEEEFIARWLNDYRLDYVRSRMAAQKHDLEQQISPDSEWSSKCNQRRDRERSRFPLEAEFAGDCVPEDFLRKHTSLLMT